MKGEFSRYFDGRHWWGPDKHERAKGKRVALRLRKQFPDADRRAILSAVYDNEAETDDGWFALALDSLQRDPHGDQWFGEDQ